ncbi:MAG TPA: GIY-YIG nuclease family protein [Luteibaculaceae bacterium]|nr:GIY-YIG nuclease family protein [Luteibaculaceae bacterium]
MKAWMYIPECADGSYYTGSTKNLMRRFAQHQSGEGANHTKKHLPVKLVYFEEFVRIDHAFFREKQVQRSSRSKKEALILSQHHRLHELAECKNESHFGNKNGGFDSAQPPFLPPQVPVDPAKPPLDSSQPPFSPPQVPVDPAKPPLDSAKSAFLSALPKGD